MVVSSYFIDGFLRQNSAPQARQYLGIEEFSPTLPPIPTANWPLTVTKSADQTVTNNDEPQNDTELFLHVEAGALYLGQMILLYSGNSPQGDYQGRLTFPDLTGAGSAMGYFAGFDFNMQPVIKAVQQGTATKWPADAIVIGVNGDLTEQLICLVHFGIRTGAGGVIQYQFANANAAADRQSVTRAGTTFRMQRLA